LACNHRRAVIDEAEIKSDANFDFRSIGAKTPHVSFSDMRYRALSESASVMKRTLAPIFWRPLNHADQRLEQSDMEKERVGGANSLAFD
jgi:hypothetical protein